MTEQTGNNKPNEAEGLAFPLSGNEKLIEEARATMRRQEWAPAGLLIRLADALEAAEKALTPTDAQVNRDYLAQVIHKAVYSRIPLEDLTDEAQADTYKRADAVVAALRAAGGVR